MADDQTPARTGLRRIDPDRAVMQPLELDPADFQSPLPVQHYAPVFEDEAIGLAVGIWDTTPMQEAFGPYPGDEYITVLEGRFTMVDAAQAPLAAARAGDSVTFRNGAPSSWKQDGDLRKIYLTLRPPGAAPPVLASTDGAFRVTGPDRRPQGPAEPDGTVREVIFRNDAGTMTVTLCAFPAQDLAASAAPSHRLVRVLAGAITLTEPGHRPETLGPGAHAVLPAGTIAAWTVAPGSVAVMVDVTAN